MNPGLIVVITASLISMIMGVFYIAIVKDNKKFKSHMVQKYYLDILLEDGTPLLLGFGVRIPNTDTVKLVDGLDPTKEFMPIIGNYKTLYGKDFYLSAIAFDDKMIYRVVGSTWDYGDKECIDIFNISYKEKITPEAREFIAKYCLNDAPLAQLV